MQGLGFDLNRDGDVPLGTQLAWQVQALIVEGRLGRGEPLPSVRRLAEVAGVNVNTVRSVYERLEGEGFVVSRQGRGTFVADNVPRLDPETVAARVRAGSGGPPRRDELSEQISALESRLTAHAAPPSRTPARPNPRLLSTEELAAVRDELAARVEQLDAMRDDLVELLGSIRMAMGEEPAPSQPRSARRAAPNPRPAPSNS